MFTRVVRLAKLQSVMGCTNHVRKYQKVGETLHRSQKLRRDLVEGLCCARLHHQQDVVCVWKVGA